MKIYKLPCRLPADALPAGCTAALGNFDGVHLGHKALFEEALKTPPCAVWTFTEPAKPNSPTPFLTDAKERLRLFSLCGLDYAVMEDFSLVKDLSCEEFVGKYLYEKLRLARVVCGFNYRFGKGGKGNAGELKKLCGEYGIECTVIPPVTIKGREISSSIIREMILCGDTEGAEALLGHPFSLTSPVIHGKNLGSLFNTPTVNQEIPQGMIIPKYGVYATAVTVDGKVFPGATNVGIRPTLNDGDKVNCETNIVGFSGDLYGKDIRIDFLKMVRDEQKFPDKGALFSQIKKDAERCRMIFTEHSERNRS